MSTRIANIISITGILLLGAYVAWMYPGLPDPMPTHWNAAGEVDDYTAKAIGAPLIAAIPIISFVIFKLIPVISPRGFRTESFRGTLNILMTATVVFGCVIGVGVMRAAQDASVDISSFVFVAVGLLLIIMGNFLGKVRKNFFLGIRTPWTLASDEVHRLGGWCFVIAGAFMAIMGVATPPSGMPWVIAVIVAIALIPVVYSYIAYRRIEGFAPDPDVEPDPDLEDQ
jgi:uncharacterized membrane protein